MHAHKPHPFHGGLHLDDHKKVSTSGPLREIPLPERLTLPLSQHVGSAAEAVVAVGDSVLKGQLIAEAGDGISARIHAPSSGTVVSIDDHAVPHPSGLSAPCIVIELDGRDAWPEDHIHVHDYRTFAPEALRDDLRNAGLVGLGGAVFPTHVKVETGLAKGTELLIINAAECEPYITCDDMQMRHEPEELTQGIEVLMAALEASRCIIGIEDNKPEAIDALQKVLKVWHDDRIQLKVIPTKYPSGGEKQLVELLTGHQIPPGEYPADLGFAVHNVGTAVAAFHAVSRGEPLISRIVTVTGSGIAEPGNCRVLLGTPMSHVIKHMGGYSDDVAELIMGGPMMGFTLPSDDLPVVKATNCLLARNHQDATVTGSEMPCIRCGECQKVCPAQLVPQQLYWYARDRDLEGCERYDLADCIECGCCAWVCPSHLPLVQYYRAAKSEIVQRDIDKAKSDIARERHEARQARHEREAAERAERMAAKKAALNKKKPARADAPAAADTAADKTSKQDAIAAAIERAKARKAEANPDTPQAED